jgi:hypothetical protein
MWQRNPLRATLSYLHSCGSFREYSSAHVARNLESISSWHANRCIKCAIVIPEVNTALGEQFYSTKQLNPKKNKKEAKQLNIIAFRFGEKVDKPAPPALPSFVFCS